jgi:hypothetical protein
VEGKCQWAGVTYKGTVSTPDEVRPKEYMGAAATTFKARFANHKTSLKYENCKQKTTLSSYYWRKKKEGYSPVVRFEILRRARPYSVETGRCGLCVEEKLAIALADGRVALN